MLAGDAFVRNMQTFECRHMDLKLDKNCLEFVNKNGKDFCRPECGQNAFQQFKPIADLVESTG